MFIKTLDQIRRKPHILKDPYQTENCAALQNIKRWVTSRSCAHVFSEFTATGILVFK